MDNNHLVSAFEAILFSSGEPVTIDRFTTVFDIAVDDVNSVMQILQNRLNERESGIELVRLDNAYQLCTRTVYGEYIRAFAEMRRKTPLSQAAMEILAIVAYNQPVTKSFIEQVRGVDCSSTVTSLVEKGLIEERGRLELPGRPLLYGTTKHFLRCFGISELSELPPLPHDENGVTSPDLGEQLSVEGMLDEDAE